ncbi:MAG: hypothetical protein LBI12_07545 [Treponema sp.]|jgi:hypothetical protein|nr:hypothetical protein [Treponema sp.]
MKTLILKLPLFFVLLLLLTGCKDRLIFGLSLEFPEVPEPWVKLLGEPHWRLEWLSLDGKKQSKVIFPGESAEIEVPAIWTNPVSAFPYWPDYNLIPGYFKPAGALFPFDIAREKLLLSWKAGPDTIFYWELAFFNEHNSSKNPANFDWPRFRELFETDVLNEAVRKDPWLVDWHYVAKKTIEANFDRRRIVPQKTESLNIPAPAGLWYGNSPFAEPLCFEEGETPSFPVYPDINVWISGEGILRFSGKTWVFTEWE